MKLSTMSIAAVFGATVLFSTVSQAEVYYFDCTAISQYGMDLRLSESLSFGDGDQKKYFWYTMVDGERVDCTQLPDFSNPENTYWLTDGAGGASGNSSGKNIIIDTNFHAGTFIDGAGGMKIYSASPDVTIRFDVLKSNNYMTGFVGENTNISIGSFEAGNWGDDIFLGAANSGWSAIRSLTAETFTLMGSGGGYWTSIYATGVENHSIYNPDVYINTLRSSGDSNLTLLGYGVSHVTRAIQSGVLVNGVSFLRTNSITERAGFAVTGSEASTGSLTVVMTNTSDATSEGNIWQGYVTRTKLDDGSYLNEYEYRDDISKGATLQFVMRSGVTNEDGSFTHQDFTQSFTGGRIYFSGGVSVMSGTLLMNYGAMGADVSHGTLLFDKEAGANTAVFGNCGTIGGNFAFDRIEVDGGGTLVIKYMGSMGSGDFVVDTITLENGGISGDGVLSIDFGTTEDSALAEFVRDSADQGVKVIAWAEGETSSVVIETLKNSITVDDTEYFFKTFNGEDGLYVSYVAVPEAADMALIFGFVAVLAAAYARRRK